MNLRENGLRSAQELAESKPHGVRLRYVAGCRCALCRKANSVYQCGRARAQKAGDWNGIVPADRAREHMLELSRLGIGRRAVGAATDIADSILHQIRKGIRKNIRARTERLILGVTLECASDKTLISAKQSRRIVKLLVEEGYTKTFLAEKLGYKTRAIQMFDQITVRNAARFRKLHEELTT